jgi:glutaredoxin 3
MLTRNVIALSLLFGALGAGTYYFTKSPPTDAAHDFKATVQIYSKAACTYCVQAKDMLRGKGAQFEEIELERTQPERRMEMRQRTGGKTSVPQIFINNQHIGGYSELMELDYEGKLDKMLSQAPGS